jgi:hypothetical protein
MIIISRGKQRREEPSPLPLCSSRISLLCYSEHSLVFSCRSFPKAEVIHRTPAAKTEERGIFYDDSGDYLGII